MSQQQVPGGQLTQQVPHHQQTAQSQQPVTQLSGGQGQPVAGTTAQATSTSTVAGAGQSQIDLKEELLQSVATLHRFETLLEIARVRAIESGRPRIARVAGDLIAITEAEKRLVIRQSPFAGPIGEAVKQTIQQGVQQLQQAAEIPEVQEALSEAQQSVDAIDRARSFIQSQEAAMAAGYQPMYGSIGQFGSLSPEARAEVQQTAMRLHNFETLLQLAEVRAFERGRMSAARIAGDLAIVANLEKRLVIRQSPFAEPISEAVKRTVQDGVQRLQQTADDPDVQAALSEANRTLEALRTLGSTGGFGSAQGSPQAGSSQEGVQQPGVGVQAQPQAGVRPGAAVQPEVGAQQTPQAGMRPQTGVQPQQQQQYGQQGLGQPTPGPY
jgi:hypothetical protein